MTSSMGLFRDVESIVQCAAEHGIIEIECEHVEILNAIRCRFWWAGVPQTWHLHYDPSFPERAFDFSFNDNEFTCYCAFNYPNIYKESSKEQRNVQQVFGTLLKHLNQYYVNVLQKLAPQGVMINIETLQEFKNLQIAYSKQQTGQWLLSLSVPLQLELGSLLTTHGATVDDQNELNGLIQLLVQYKQQSVSSSSSDIVSPTALQLISRRTDQPGFNEELRRLTVSPWQDQYLLSEYVQMAASHVQQQILTISESRFTRKALLRCLPTEFPSHVLEMDNVTWRHASYLLLYNTRQIVLIVHLPMDFPKTGPSVKYHMLSVFSKAGQSTGRGQHNRAVEQEMKLAWSSEWGADEMSRKISKQLMSELPGWVKKNGALVTGK